MTHADQLDSPSRITALEHLLGDASDAANPFGHEALRAADERGEPDPEAEAALIRFGVNAEFVPVALGGRLERMDTLARVGRAVFRRDTALGIGHAAASLPAAMAVWAAGTPRQHRWTADLLLRGGRLAVAHHELASGNDLVRGEFEAVPYQDGFLLDGAKPAVAHAVRADALVVFGRTSPEAGGHSHSALLVDRAALPADRFALVPHRRTMGLRGRHIGGLEFHDCPVPGEALLGGIGDGVELTLRTFQVTRSVVPAMVLGGADTALRTAVGHGLEHPVYGGPPLSHPHHRATVARAFVTLLVCDCLSLVAARALHLSPEWASLPAAVTEYLVPRLLKETVYDLAAVLGARFHAGEGGFGNLRRYLRDLPMTGLGHAGTAACLATITPQLPGLARRPLPTGGAVLYGLFGTDEELPPLDLGRQTLVATGDMLAASLVAVARSVDALDALPGEGGAEPRLLRDLVRGLVGELRRLREDCRALPADDLIALATPQTYALADRYALVLAGAACLGVWQWNSAGPPSFLADPAWLVEALMGISQRLGLAVPARESPSMERVLREVLERYHSARSYDLYASDVYGLGPTG